MIVTADELYPIVNGKGISPYFGKFFSPSVGKR
jgi:hypothetical protein